MPQSSHSRLVALIQSAQQEAKTRELARIGIVYPCDSTSMEGVFQILQAAVAQPVLIGPKESIGRLCDSVGVNLGQFELIDTDGEASGAAHAAAEFASRGGVDALMKGSLHTDELMSAILNKSAGLRGPTRISHTFVFDLPNYHKLIALADCVVNISPNLETKRDILTNAIWLLRKLDIAEPKIGIVAAVETVNPAIPATVDAQSLVEMARQGYWPGTIIEGPFGFDNAISRRSADIKKIQSLVAGDPDLLLMPDLNSGNILYKSFNYIGGGDCAGLVLGAKVPVVLTSRADSLQSRVASVALAVLATKKTITS